MIRSVSIIGMGALGIMYGDFLTEKLGPETVSFIADKKRIEKYLSDGVFCNGKKCIFTVRDCDSDNEPADLLVFAVKGTALDSALLTAANLVGKDTIIISLLNGISSEEIIGKVFGLNHLVYCVAQGMDAVRTENKVEYSHMGELCIGLPENLKENQQALRDIAGLFDRIHLPYHQETDIMHRLWSKWMLNVGVNQVVMVSQGTYRTIQANGPERELMKSAMNEVIQLAEKEHIDLTKKDLDEYVALIDTLNPDGMPSMRQDGLAGRKTEVELFSGTVIRKARKYGLPVPVNQKLYDTVRKMENTLE